MCPPLFVSGGRGLRPTPLVGGVASVSGCVSASGSLDLPRIRVKSPTKKPVATSILRPFTFCPCRLASRQNGGASKSGRFRLLRRRFACRRNTPSASATIGSPASALRFPAKNSGGAKLAVERRSERGDSAYSPRVPRGGAFGRRQRVNSGEGLCYLLKISSRTFFGASSNWSVSIEYEARPFVSERIAVA